MAKVLVVYYSRTGTTHRLAEAIAREGGFDLEELRDLQPRLGLLGYLRCSLDALLERRTELAPLAHHPGDYDLVIVGGPIWNAGVSSPVRTFLQAYGPRLKQVAFFLTYGGFGEHRAIAQMTHAAGRSPRLVCPVKARRVAHGGYTMSICLFVEQLMALIERPHLVHLPPDGRVRQPPVN